MTQRAEHPLHAHADILGAALERLCGPLDAATQATLFEQVRIVHLEVGDRLYRQGDSGDSIHIVLSGRLRVEVHQVGGGSRILAHPQRGEVVGEIAWLTGAPRAATVHAARDSTLGQIERATLDRLIAEHPAVYARIAQMIIRRLSDAQSHRPALAQYPHPAHAAHGNHPSPRTVLLIPLHDSLPRAAFLRDLRQALLGYGSVLQLDSTATNRCPAEGLGRLFDDAERSHDLLLLIADPQPGTWTRKCLGHADRILLIADATRPPELTPLERWLAEERGQHGSDADIELLLLHPPSQMPKGTRDWRAARSVSRHHHLHLTGSTDGPQHCIDPLDLSRLARELSGHPVSLVLAGGGARGFAHLGVIRALRDCGMPIDAIGGASFGALAATGIARGLGDDDIMEELRIAFSDHDPIGDYTLPVISMVRGERLDQLLSSALPMDIEDLWLPFFAVSSDITTNRVRIHDHGPLWRAIRASVSLPAILPPALEHGHLLIDGGVLNNLPVDIMRERMRGYLIAVDLAVEQEYRLQRERVPSGFEYLKSRWLPGQPALAAPTIPQIMMKLTTLASQKDIETAHRLADLHLNPPLGTYDFLDWDCLREIADIGYQYALPRIEQWSAEHPRLIDRSDFIATWLQERTPARPRRSRPPHNDAPKNRMDT
jgi:predicted acylesterase/phospholipase RssA/CRP-like cAMP-binding protein